MACGGELDAPANPKGPERVAILRAYRPDADVRLIPKNRSLGPPMKPRTP